MPAAIGLFLARLGRSQGLKPATSPFVILKNGGGGKNATYVLPT